MKDTRDGKHMHGHFIFLSPAPHLLTVGRIVAIYLFHTSFRSIAVRDFSQLPFAHGFSVTVSHDFTPHGPLCGTQVMLSTFNSNHQAPCRVRATFIVDSRNSGFYDAYSDTFVVSDFAPPPHLIPSPSSETICNFARFRLHVHYCTSFGGE